MRQRKRKPGVVDLTGHENTHVQVVNEVTPGLWLVNCKRCGSQHTQASRQIKNEALSMECEYFKPHNWSGLEREDAIMRRQYGISMADFELLLEFQGNCCAICRKPINKIRRRMNVDHDHTTNEVRGILCSGCNTGLGHLGDDIAGLETALYYLKNTPFSEFNR